MALQTKTYETGDYSLNSLSNGYKIHLTLTEESTSTSNNTSLITYTFSISNTDNTSAWTGGKIEFSWSISIGGQTIPIYNFFFELNEPYTTQIITYGQITVAHNSDGTLSMPFSASIPDVQNRVSEGPPAMTIEGTMDLTPIAVTPATIPVLFNGTQLNSVVFNGQHVTQLIFNGTTVY